MPHPEEAAATANAAAQAAALAALAPALGIPLPHLLRGLWTPVDASGAGLALVVGDAYYVRHESLVLAFANLAYPVTVDASNALIGGLPFTVENRQGARQGIVSYTTAGPLFLLTNNNQKTANLFTQAAGAPITNAGMSNKPIWFIALYTTTEP